MLWVSIVQLLVILWVWKFKKKDWGEAGFLNLMLVANNYGMVGLPVMNATFGQPGRSISLLCGEYALVWWPVVF